MRFIQTEYAFWFECSKCWNKLKGLKNPILKQNYSSFNI